MLADTTDARRGERKNAPPIFDTAVPHVKKQGQPQGQGQGQNEEDGNGGMQFSLMLKKGNRQQVRYNTHRLRLLMRQPYRLGDTRLITLDEGDRYSSGFCHCSKL